VLPACSDNLGPSSNLVKKTSAEPTEVKRSLIAVPVLNLTPEEQLSMSNVWGEGTQLGRELVALHKKGVSLGYICTKADKILIEHAKKPYPYLVQQEISSVMVNLLVENELDAQTTNALRNYTKILVDNNNPNLPLLRKSFIKLKDYWEVGEATRYQKKAIEDARAWLSMEEKRKLMKTEGCKDCPKEIQEGHDLENAATEKSNADIKAAIDQLAL